MTRRSAFADKLKEFPSFVFGDHDVTRHRGTWREHFQSHKDHSLAPVPGGEGTKDHSPAHDNRTRRLILEIGCFDGTFLARVAEKHPYINFIGLDWKARPLYLGAQRIALMNLTNLALLRARAQDLACIFDEAELDEIWLFHPDPFDNERERDMRLMSAGFLDIAGRLLKSDGRLILKTDHVEYFESTRSLLRADTKRFRIELESHDFWNDSAAIQATRSRAFAGESTHFERRFIRRKQPIFHLQSIRR